MTELMINSKETMTSREIARIAGRMHKHVLRDIRTMEPAWERITGTKFGLSEYKDPTGRSLPEYQLNKLECLYIATKFNDEARARLVIRWEELEILSRRNSPSISVEAIRAIIREELSSKSRPALQERHQRKSIGYDTEQLAEIAGASRRSVQRWMKNLNIRPIAYWNNGSGRPAAIYSQAVCNLIKSRGIDE